MTETGGLTDESVCPHFVAQGLALLWGWRFRLPTIFLAALQPAPERRQQQYRRQHDAARPHVVHRFGLKRVYREQIAAATSAARSGSQAPQALVGQQHRAQMQQQVEDVVPRASCPPVW
jgi:hypothetical protein